MTSATAQIALVIPAASAVLPQRAIYVYSHAYAPLQGEATMLHVPNKTIYVSDGDLTHLPAGAGARRRQPLGGDRRCPPALCRRRGGPKEGFDEVIVRVGPGKGRKVRFTGVLLGEWLELVARAASTTTASGAAGRASTSSTRARARTDGWSTPTASRPAGAATWASATSATAARPAESTLDVVGPLDELHDRVPPSSSTWSRAALASRPSRTSTSESRPHRRSPGRRAMTAADRDPAIQRPRPPQVVRQAGRPRRHRPRGRRGHRLRAPRAERRRQDDDRPHPLDAHRGRRRRGPDRRVTTSPASRTPSAP